MMALYAETLVKQVKDNSVIGNCKDLKNDVSSYLRAVDT